MYTDSQYISCRKYYNLPVTSRNPGKIYADTEASIAMHGLFKSACCPNHEIVSDLQYIQYMAPLVGSLIVVTSRDVKRTFGEYAYQNNKKNIMATVGSNNTKSDR